MGKMSLTGNSATRRRLAVLSDAAAPFSPSDLTGLVLWMDGADTSKQTFSGSTVLTWTDKSSNAYVFTSHGAPQPVATTLNGLAAIAFNAANTTDFSKTGAVAIDGNTDFTIFTVAKVAATNIVASIFTEDSNNTTGGDSQTRVLINNNKSHSLMSNTTVNRVSIVGTATWGTTNPHITVFRRNGTAMDQSTDTSADGTGTLTGAAGTPTQMLIGKVAAASQYMTGTIAEIIVYNDNLSDADRDTVVTYLKAKWGTP